MSKYKVGIVGCGRPWKSAGATGFGMAHLHAKGYEATPDAEIVAAADISQENLDAFCAEHTIPHGYLSADAMFANEELDIVSICLWPHLHAEMTVKAAEAGVKAIHCEKPMALTFGEARRMVEVCDAHNVLLTFNHMRRFGAPFRKAKELLDSGAIGALERVEAFTSNLYDWGTHWFDMMFMYNDETPVEWVIGQIDARGGHPIFGAPLEGQGLSTFKWQNGVMGMMVTGYGTKNVQSTGCAQRLIGSDGIIEVGVDKDVQVRLRNAATSGVWHTIAVDGGLHGDDLHVQAVLDLIDALNAGRAPELLGHRALQATELIFATYESSRRRARVDLPLDIEDSPLVSMLNNGDMTTWYDGFVEANSIRQHYWRTGDGTKPTLVLCHGVTDNGLCWTPVARALENDFDVIMVDARGHGLSDAPKSGYTNADRAADVAALIQALGLEKPAILGHSMGGATVGTVAATYPELISKVLLEDPAWFEDDAPQQTMTDADRRANVTERRTEIINRAKLSREALIAENRQNSPLWSEEERGNWAIAKQQVNPNIVNIYAKVRGPWRDIAQKFQCPALLITADVDKGAIVTKAMATEATQINPYIQVAHIPGVGHNIRREAFQAYMAVVKRFLLS
ncbi:MAG: alpha/beta fold hydrolase [Anaerolineae bacterium]|nr:alpha/beta fold hydrolase [Anaerolineae bacterium]